MGWSSARRTLTLAAGIWGDPGPPLLEWLRGARLSPKPPTAVQHLGSAARRLSMRLPLDASAPCDGRCGVVFRRGTATHGPPELRRRLVSHERDLGQPHARGRGPGLRGTAARLRRPARARPLAPAPRAALPPEARLPPHGARPPVLDRRPELQPFLPRAPLGAPGAGIRGAAAKDGGASLLAAARPHQAAVGALARPGAEAKAVCSDHEDPPRGRRWGLRRRHRHGPLRC